MDLKIINKQYPRNDKYNKNKVKFTVDGYELYINIIYLEMTFEANHLRRFNAFLDDKLYEQCEQFITGRYPNMDFEDFKKYFMYKLYKYSRGVGLDKECLDITPEIIKRIEEA